MTILKPKSFQHPLQYINIPLIINHHPALLHINRRLTTNQLTDFLLQAYHVSRFFLRLGCWLCPLF